MTEHQRATVQDPTAGALEIFQQNKTLTAVLGATLLVVITFFAYVPALGGDFIWDDDYYVTNNRLLQTWSGLQRIWFDVVESPRTYPLPQYYPMTHTSFWIEYRLWGLNPTGYHVTNVLLHAANALLIWLLLRKLAVPGAWVAAAIFAVHPINVESVAWIAERKNVLSGFFFFSSLYVYLRFAGVIPGPEKPSEYFSLPKEPERVYALALVLFVFALLSKTVTATLPAVVLLIMWWKRGRFSAKDVLWLIPLFVLGAAAGSLTSWMEQHRVGAAGAEWDYGLVSRFIIAGRALWFYVGKLVVPHPLIFNYPRWDPHDTSPLLWIFPLSFIAVIVLLIVFRKQLGRGPATAVLYFLGTLFPALGFVNVFPHRYSFVADHFVYLSGIGLIALAVAGIAWACARFLPRDISLSGAPAAAAAGAILIFFLLSLMRTPVYAGPKTLWEDTIQRNPQSWLAANNYAVWMRDHYRPPHLTPSEVLDLAEHWFESVMRKRPEHPESRYNMGVIAEMRGERDRAWHFYEEALNRRPDYAPALFRLARIYQSQGNIAAAEENYRRVIELVPHDFDAHLSLGRLHAQREEYDAALDAYQKAAEIDPASAAPFLQIGNVLARQGRGEEAMQYYAEAGRLEPNNPLVANNVGFVFLTSGYLQEARVWFERALKLNPRMIEAITNLGTVYAQAGEPEEARKLFERALQLDPQFERAQRNLAALEEGRLTPATTQAATVPAAGPATEPATQPQRP